MVWWRENNGQRFFSYLNIARSSPSKSIGMWRQKLRIINPSVAGNCAVCTFDLYFAFSSYHIQCEAILLNSNWACVQQTRHRSRVHGSGKADTLHAWLPAFLNQCHKLGLLFSIVSSQICRLCVRSFQILTNTTKKYSLYTSNDLIATTPCRELELMAFRFQYC